MALAFIVTLLLSETPRGDPATDPVLCTTAVPEGIGGNTALLAGDLADAKEVTDVRNAAEPVSRSQKREGGNPSSPPAGALTMGFYVNWDDNSFPALEAALPHLDWVIPAWLSLQGPDMALATDVDQKVLDLIARKQSNTLVLPLLQNAVNDNWDGDGLARLLADPARRTERVTEIVAFLERQKLRGITVDFEEVPRDAHKYLRTFLEELRAAFSPRGWMVALAAPFANDDWDYSAYGRLADYVILMAYDRHWATGTPGSIAPRNWFTMTLRKRMRSLDPRRTILALGNYGYDWAAGRPTETITFQEALLKARHSGVKIHFDPESKTPLFSYIDDNDLIHGVWFLDGVTAFDEIHAADDFRPAGYALWRLGSEDPSIWSVLGRPYGAPAPDAIISIPAGQGINVQGSGEILRIQSAAHAGSRTVRLDPANGEIDEEAYHALPTSYVVERFGAGTKKIALTFDDGPDPVWTAKVLDILKEKNVHATFFVIGQHAQANPDLIRRMVAEGHDVGNHTYTHPNIGLIPGFMAKVELNATQKLFEGLTGRSLRLFRPPYLGDAEPSTSEEVRPIELAQSLGYWTVGVRIDPGDWRSPPSQEIVDRVLEKAADANPNLSHNIVLLHDAGGDRSATIAALPKLIDALRQQGFEIVPVSELAGLTRDQAMPVLKQRAATDLLDQIVFSVLRWLNRILPWLFWVAIGLGLARVVFLCAFAVLNSTRRVQTPSMIGASPPLQSVLIPAFNEAKVIASSIEHVLAADYPNLEVIVVDDGSRDGTAEVVRAHFAGDDRVRLITTPNRGKAHALNLALQHARGSVVVALDADTQFKRDTISKLIRWFQDARVGAVAGNAKVGNRVNIVTRCQALEYITAQNLERRALAALGCVTVVPGAVGAWRKEVLDRLGGFPIDTVAEDQDLTIAIQRMGYKVLFDADAVAYTEAPDSVSALTKQRFRWAFGTLQCLWKHRDAVLRPRYGALGLVALPQTLLFQVLFSLLSPIIDLAFILQILGIAFDYMNHGDEFDSSHFGSTLTYYLIFVLCDLGGAAIAFAIDRSERWKLLWCLVLQRYGYRQLVYCVVIRAVNAASCGFFVGWGKLDRKATVTTLRSGTPAAAIVATVSVDR